MFRLGTRPDRKRTSPAPDASTLSVSPDRVLIDTGTSWMFSTLRCAVTSTVSSTAARDTVSCACADSGRASAMANAERRVRWNEGRRELDMFMVWFREEDSIRQVWRSLAGVQT